VTITHLRPGIRPQIKDRLDAERSQLLVVTAFGLRAVVEVIVDFPEVLDHNSNVIARRPLPARNGVSRQQEGAGEDGSESEAQHKFTGQLQRISSLKHASRSPSPETLMQIAFLGSFRP